VNSRAGQAVIFLIGVAAVSLVAGCSKEPDRTDARISVLESNLNNMTRDMEGIRAHLTQNEAQLFKLSNPSNKPASPPAANPPIANGSAPNP